MAGGPRLLILALASCGAEPAVDADLPAGALLFGDGPAVERALRCTERFRESPLAKEAAATRARIGKCTQVASSADAGEDLLAGAACASTANPLAARAAGHSLAFAWPLDDGRRAVGTVDVAEDGALSGVAEVAKPAAPSLAGMLVGGADAGPAVLSHDEAFAHARVRPAGGIDLAALVPEGGQGDRMFRLRNSLFAGALLDGTWEAAMYLPEAGHTVPRIALAIGVRNETAAETAMEGFIADLQGQWEITRAAYTAGEARGACLPDLNLLPRLAPCYVVSRSSLVLGWDPGSVEHALRGSGEALPSGISIDAAQLVAADARIAEAEATRGRPPADAPIAYPWGTVSVSAEEAGDRIRWSIRTSEGCR